MTQEAGRATQEGYDASAEPSPMLAPQRRRGALEAVLLVVPDPLPVARLAAGLQLAEGEVLAMLQELASEFQAAGRGWVLREVAGGWRLFADEDYAEEVTRFLVEGQSARLSAAAMETLAVIAYRQPVSRARVAAVRGVSVDGVVRTLLTRGLVAESGQEPTSGATLYETTPLFLERLGLRDLTELPPLAPLLPDSEAASALDALGSMGG